MDVARCHLHPCPICTAERAGTFSTAWRTTYAQNAAEHLIHLIDALTELNLDAHGGQGDSDEHQ